jgi:hypothetical protein
MRTTALLLSLTLAGAAVLSAQESRAAPEIRPFVGVSIPTGTQRDLFNDAPVFGLQGAVELKPTLHLVGTFGLVRGQTQYVSTQDNVNIFQYDVGVELGMVRELSSTWQFRPYLGLGAGARTYAYEAGLLAGKTCAQGYGAAGAEFQVNRTSFRLEARDNVFCFKSPIAGEDSKTRNDIQLTAAFAYHFR